MSITSSADVVGNSELVHSLDKKKFLKSPRWLTRVYTFHGFECFNELFIVYKIAAGL